MIWSPVGLAEELRFFVHVLLDLSPVDVPEQRADVGRAEHITQIRSTPDPQHTPNKKKFTPPAHPPTFVNVSFCFGDKACCDIFGFCRSYSIHCTLQKDLIKGEEIRLAIKQKSLKKPDTLDLMSSKI